MGLSHLLHLRRLFSLNPHLYKAILINQLTLKPFSSSSPTSDERNPKPTSLSARMSFVFDQIDTIEKERSQKDETLQRIRAWRESKKEKQSVVEHEEGVRDTDQVAVSGFKDKGLLNKGVELVHPWPEWIELMERLVQQNYFDCRRKDEDKMISDSGFSGLGAGDGIVAEAVEEGFDFTRDWKTVQTAGLNFGKDRFDILRSLSRKDIQILVGYGCPSADKKVVFSAKLLRKHVHLDEGDVCSSCRLRSSCERAYLLTNKEDEARTIDIMRVLLIYGFDPVNGSVVNDSLLKKKSVKTVIRKLLHEVVKLSGIPIDPSLPPPIIKRPPPKVKQTPPPPKKRVGRDDVEMKKGDWLCPKCDFMNFAKNIVCLQCDAKRPKRQLLPGEWECPECKFLNYRRNMACFHCECKRPPDEFIENQMQERQPGRRTRLDGIPSRKEVSDAWNFDFDENESDGAEVAAFEYADSRKLDEDFPTTRQRDEETMTRSKDNPFKNRSPKRPHVGFDDFDDEEQDDVDGYELDMNQHHSQLPNSSSVNFSDLDVDSESEDAEATNDNWNARRPVSSFSSQRNRMASKPRHQNSAFSEDDSVDFNSDEDLPVHPNWKSSHVFDFRPRTRGKMAAKFGSDEGSDLSSSAEDSDDADFPPKRKGWRTTSSNNYRKVHDDSFDEGSRFSRGGSRGHKAFPDRRRNPAKGFNSSKGLGPRGNHDGLRSDAYNDDSRDFRSHRRENFSDKQKGRTNKSYDSPGVDSYLDHERYSRPRVNVR